MQKQAQHYADHHEAEVRDPKTQSGWYQEGWLSFAQFEGGTLLDKSSKPMIKVELQGNMK